VKVRIQYMAQVRQAAGVAEDGIEMERPCLAADLLLRLAGQRGDTFRRLVVDEQGRLQPTLLVFVGEEQIGPNGGRLLRDGDVITVLSPMAGG
jgi:molybdopterin converting factor small subunit